VNREETIEFSGADLPALQRLVLAYAPATARPWQALCWHLDQRLASVARRGGDPTIAAIRLAWWDAVLVEADPAKGAGEPLVERWRAMARDEGAAVGRLIDGWRMLVSPEALTRDDLLEYGRARGGGLFALLAAGQPELSEALERSGTLWALWDLAAHVRDEDLARRAMAVARDVLGTGRARAPSDLPRPLRLLSAAIMPDVRAGRVPRAAFTPAHYARLLIASLRG